MATSDLTSKFLGCLIGKALGDAIGELAFAMPAEAALRRHVAKADVLVYTDDTAMALGIAESLVEAGDLDLEHLGRRFHDNFLREPWRGYGPGPPSIFAAVERTGLPYRQVAGRLFGGEGSLGNGAAMRVAPVGLAYRASPELAEKARLSAAVTHTHPVGMDGAAVQATAVALATVLDPEAPLDRQTFCRRLIGAAQSPEIRGRMELVRTLVSDGAPAKQAADAIGRSVAMQESMPFAIFAFLSHPDSFEDCLFTAALNGGDRDTLAAMACAISGAYLGLEAIPEAWRARLENHDLIAALSRRLARMAL
ncbi:MAG: ADP-ribosylglycohydrolase family protein [Kiloniellales bacterium]|jgi:poly(ADP-ribose) glycohydrolase ARH3